MVWKELEGIGIGCRLRLNKDRSTARKALGCNGCCLLMVTLDPRSVSSLRSCYGGNPRGSV